MRYVSTRGEAPPLGFMDVPLAGLARDGGLYVPESFPQIAPETISGFAGKPYAEIAVEGHVDEARLFAVHLILHLRASPSPLCQHSFAKDHLQSYLRKE